MVIAGWILLGIGSFFTLVSFASNILYKLLVLSFVYLIIPGVVFISIGYSIKTRRRKRMLQGNKQVQQSYTCPECNFKVFENYKCCPHCGVSLIFEVEKGKYCSGCGKELVDGYDFCPYCGTKR